jgi:hypothetical protein
MQDAKFGESWGIVNWLCLDVKLKFTFESKTLTLFLRGEHQLALKEVNTRTFILNHQMINNQYKPQEKATVTLAS